MSGLGEALKVALYPFQRSSDRPDEVRYGKAALLEFIGGVPLLWVEGGVGVVEELSLGIPEGLKGQVLKISCNPVFGFLEELLFLGVATLLSLR